MIRAVLDTNVYVAALLSRTGSPAQLMSALSEGLFDAVVCPRLLSELEGVLSRPKIAHRVAPDDARAFVGWLARVAVTEADPACIPCVSPDANDDYLFALAIDGRAQVIVSGDANVLEVNAAQLRVLSPAAFATLVESLR